MRTSWLLGSLILMSLGCRSTSAMERGLDDLAFEHFGCTIFSSPSALSLKEIHLGKGAPADVEVVVEGTVAEIGPHGTYLVLGDESARLLVVLTDVAGEFGLSGAKTAVGLKVLGAIEGGKKGLPLLRARAINISTSRGVGGSNA